MSMKKETEKIVKKPSEKSLKSFRKDGIETTYIDCPWGALVAIQEHLGECTFRVGHIVIYIRMRNDGHADEIFAWDVNRERPLNHLRISKGAPWAVLVEGEKGE